MPIKKQAKITKMFRSIPRQPEEDCDDLEEEVLRLEQTLQEKRDQFLQLMKNKHKVTRAPQTRDSETIVQPQRIVLNNSIESIKSKLALVSMVSGMEVQSYVAGEHCAVVYHMQHDTDTEVKHGLMISIRDGKVSKSSLPVGFNLSTILEGFDNVLQSDCLLSVRKGLLAYYDRLEQCNKLKKLLNTKTRFFMSLDGSHVEITFVAENENEESPEPLEIKLVFDYRVYDIRPKQLTLNEEELSETAEEVIRHQCLVFKKKQLHEAFKEAFVEGNGAYVMVTEDNTEAHPDQQRKRKTKPLRPPTMRYNNDDTFRPEECSESDEEVE